jgi:rod shape determining protein RodA
MSKRQQRGLRNVDWLTFSLFLSLLIVGWLMIFAVGYEESTLTSPLRDYILNPNTLLGKQTIWIGVSFIVMVFVFFLDERFWHSFAYPIYGAGLLLLIGVLLFGTEIKGAKSWFTLGGMSLQPSELVKFGSSLAMAAFLASYTADLRLFRNQLTGLSIVTFPVFLIMLQPDLGSALVFFALLIPMYRKGMPSALYLIGLLTASLFILGLIFGTEQVIAGLFILALGIIAFDSPSKRFRRFMILLALIAANVWAFIAGYGAIALISNAFFLFGALFYQWLYRNSKLIRPVLGLVIIGSVFTSGSSFAFNELLKPHQQDRINVWLRPRLCDMGDLYNVEQSKIAIGSGGLEGKGFLKGTMTKGNFVPEQSTDFIFCTIGEEQGFIGSFAVIFLFLMLLLRLVFLAERQRTEFSRYFIYSISGILFLHFAVNIGMTLGLLPVIGIPLPLISYGGSSLLGFSLMMGVLLRLDADRFTVAL